MKNIITSIGLFCVSVGFAQIGINNPTPSAKAELDIQSTSKGILIPRLPRNSIAPLFGAITNVAANQGMLLYQTNTVGTNLPGFYYNNFGWFPVRSTGGWSLFGQTGINPLFNFVGTSDVLPFKMRTTNADRLTILADGKIGIGTTTPSVDLHLVGTPSTTLKIEDGYAALGNYLSCSADGTATWRTPASLGFAGWSVLGNAGTSSANNFIGTPDLQDFVIRTNGIESLRVQADGNVRINSGLTLSQLQINANSPTIPVVRAINTNTTPNTFSFGVIGTSNSTDLGSYSVRGTIIDIDGTSGIGVLGEVSPTSTGGTGVYGRAWSANFANNLPSTTPNYVMLNLTSVPNSEYINFVAPDNSDNFGVFGTVNYFTGRGVYGFNSNLAIGSAYGMYCFGNFAVTSAKPASIPTTKGNQLVYCKESPEMWFEDFGFATLQNGVAHIALDGMFLETVFIDDAHKMHVVLQEQAESNGLYVVVDDDHKGFTVKEKKSGTSNASFSYSLMAKRRFYQDHRFGVDANQPFENNLAKTKYPELLTTDPMVMKAYVEKVTAEKNALGASLKKQEESKQKEASKTSN